jgi:hypothetical protein
MKMPEPVLSSPEAAGWLAAASAFFWKFMPAPMGAVVMVLFDTPKTRKELFIRLTVAYLFGVMFGEVFFAFLKSFGLFSFLDIANRRHYGAVEFFTAGCGWSLLAAWATLQRRLRADPEAALGKAREIIS